MTKNTGVPPFGTILMGRSKPNPYRKGFMWPGKTTDITEAAIKAVFEHMYIKATQGSEDANYDDRRAAREAVQ